MARRTVEAISSPELQRKEQDGLGALRKRLTDWHASPVLWRIGIGIAVTLLAATWRLAMSGTLEDRVPYVTFYPAVLLAGLAGGLVSGAVTLLLSLLAAHLWIAPLSGFGDVIALAAFSTGGLLMIGITEALHRTLARMNEMEARRATEQITAENARLAEQFGSVAASAPGVIYSFRLDASGKRSFPYISANVQNVCGVTPEQIESDSRLLFDRIHPEDLERVNAKIDDSAQNLSPFHSECRFYHPSKGLIWLEAQSMPARKPDGSCVWHGYARDITDRKRADAERREVEIALARRATELERANQRLAQFAYVASHDLQEPLRKIAAFSDLLESAIAADNGADVVYANQVMRGSALRARELVDDLLTYSRTINDAQQLQSLDLRDEIQSSLTDLSESIRETGAHVSIDVPAVKFRADRSQFARLMHNLLSNALKYRNPDVLPRIGISAIPSSENAIRLAICDNGTGFEAKYAETVFEPFKRLHSKAQYPGTGIGLAICKSIAERHGWKLSAQSQPGQGATFFVDMSAPRVEVENSLPAS